MRLHVTFQLPGEPVQNPELFARAWDEFPELKCTSRSDWCGRSLHSLSEFGRWEIGVIHDGAVVGGLVLLDDPWDCHVGPCVTVAAQYVLPEYRNRGVSGILMRQALRTVKSQSGPKTLAYTHRVGPWRYETIYRRIQMKMPKVDNSGAEAATRAQTAAQEAATTLKKNFQADLSTENLAQVVAGGSAAASSDMMTGTLKRRRGGGLSSQLGIAQ